MPVSTHVSYQHHHIYILIGVPVRVLLFCNETFYRAKSVNEIMNMQAVS